MTHTSEQICKSVQVFAASKELLRLCRCNGCGAITMLERVLSTQ